MIYFYYGASYAVAIIMMAYELFCLMERKNKKRYYLIPIILFPLSYIISVAFKYMIILIDKVISADKGKIKKVKLWLSKDLTLKNKRKSD